MRRFWKSGGVAALGIAVLALASVVGAGPAIADDTARGTAQEVSEPQLVGVESARMVLACDEFTGHVLTYAVKHGYCPDPTAGGSGTVTTQASQTYDCGTTWVYLYNYGVRGDLWIEIGFHSTQGVVVYRNLSVGYAAPNGSSGGWNDASWMWSTDYESETYEGNFGLGWASATLSGTVNLVWGGWCTMPPLTDSNTI